MYKIPTFLAMACPSLAMYYELPTASQSLLTYIWAFVCFSLSLQYDIPCFTSLYVMFLMLGLS
jgi:hypothetical protein